MSRGDWSHIKTQQRMDRIRRGWEQGIQVKQEEKKSNRLEGMMRENKKEEQRGEVERWDGADSNSTNSRTEREQIKKKETNAMEKRGREMRRKTKEDL